MDEKELVKVFEIAAQKGIRELDLSNKEIKTLPSEIYLLSRVQKLNLSNNLLTTLPSEIGNLTGLYNLDLRNNRIVSLPQGIENLSNLRILNISNNQLANLPATISHIPKIWELDLSDNSFSKFPIEVLRLVDLQALHIRNNHISSVPPNIKDLSRLQVLNLNNNKITSLPSELATLKNLSMLDLQGNSLPIPDEILSKTSEPISILNYYQRLLVEKREALNEAKVLIVGQGSVGKTSLINRLVKNTFDPAQTKTDGIAIERVTIQTSNSEKIRLNVWDFGGQEIMHATHQFFLTRRSLYILVLDSRLTQEENRVEYWLKMIQSFGGDSPIIIVGSKTDQHPLDIDALGLIKKYPLIMDVIETSASNGKGIEELKTAITKGMEQLPHIHDQLLRSWFSVKTELERMKDDYISYDEYLRTCTRNGIVDQVSQQTLIGFLHDLGVVLHFQDDNRLAALGILNPEWVTNGVYKIINSDDLFQNKGVLESKMLLAILNHRSYPFDKYMFIIDMMKKFELCYNIEVDKKYLVPDLLPKNEPIDLKFNGIPAFEYAYPVLPSSIITRFIVRMNQKIHNGLVWRTGVLLKIGENLALVKADIEDRKITIAIEGLEHTRRDALSAIRYQLDEIHNSIKGLGAEKKVPVPNAPKTEPLKYEYLLKLERAGQETLLVENGNDLVTVNVRQMLSAIESEAQRKEDVSGGVTTNYYIHGDVNASGDFIGRDKNISAGDQSVVVGGDVSGNLISGNYNKINSAEIDPELKQTLLQLGEAVDVMLQKLPAEQANEATEDFGKLADEAIKPKPNKKWYSVSIEGLIAAAENVEKVGEPVINLSRKVLSLLTGGVIK